MGFGSGTNWTMALAKMAVFNCNERRAGKLGFQLAQLLWGFKLLISKVLHGNFAIIASP